VAEEIRAKIMEQVNAEKQAKIDAAQQKAAQDSAE